ncbi:hypothetical protein KP509_01G064700 [Ceratopteris richardii]|uniref:Uncharacterized protein n=1 Tax=Ceratopteris richardii TaxID=49495 RepID=A0A8T2VQ79_CERRI|nr:hypothetical protein KP509_01G064700 [Ceratopteris richardii]
MDHDGVSSRGYGGSDSNSVILTSSSSFSSAFSSSDIDTVSTSSFFHDRRATLGSLIGAMEDADLIGADPFPSVFYGPGRSHGEILIDSFIRNAPSVRPTTSQTTRTRTGTFKLRSLFDCGTCKGLCYSESSTCRVAYQPKKAKSDNQKPAAALGRLLVAERYAERSMDGIAGGNTSNEAARVCLNIIYEDTAGMEHVATNPLFGLDSVTPTTTGNPTVQIDSGVVCNLFSEKQEGSP